MAANPNPTQEEVVKIRRMILSGKKPEDVAELFGVSVERAKKCVRNFFVRSPVMPGGKMP